MFPYCKNRRVLHISLLVLVSAALFGNTFRNEFLWDDLTLIKSNRYIRDAGNIPLFFTPHYWNDLHPFPGGYIRPVTMVSLTTDYFFWKLKPAGYHLTNILLHMANIILVYALVSLVAGEEARRPDTAIAGPGLCPRLPFLTALFFAVHPIHTESVNLIKNRSDLLAFLFFQMSFLLFVKYSAATGRPARRRLLPAAWLLFVPALLSKEIALTLPGVLAWYALCFSPVKNTGKALIRIIPFGAIIAAYFWYMHVFIGPLDEWSVTDPRPLGVVQHALTVVKTMGVYLGMLAAPFSLNVEHRFTIPESVLDPGALAALLILLLPGAVLLRMKQRPPIVSFATGWMVMTLLPAANIVYLMGRPIAEQRLYIPSFGFCLLLAYGIERLSYSGTKRLNLFRATVIGGVLTAAAAVLYAGITVRRNLDWRNDLALFSRTLIANPDSARVHNNLGVALSRADRYEEAIRHYRTALNMQPDYIAARFNLGLLTVAVNPNSVSLHNNLGQSLCKVDRYEEAVSHFLTALRLDPYSPVAYNNLGMAAVDSGHFQEAARYYETALRLDPDYAVAHHNLGALFAKTARWEDAIRHYYTALRLEPDVAETHNNLGLALAATGRPEEAVTHFSAAISLNPDDAGAHMNLGVVLAASDRPQEAIRHYETALRLDPDNADIHNNLCAALIRAGRWPQAVRHASEALRLKPDHIRALNNLGLALTATGRVEEAVGYYRAAMERMPDNADTCCNLGVALMIQGNTQAAALLSRALQLDPGHEKARQAYRECLERMD